MTPLGPDAEHEAKILDAYRDYVASGTQEERRVRWLKVAELHAQRSAQQVLRMERDMKLT
jgi:hypothetical protein